MVARCDRHLHWRVWLALRCPRHRTAAMSAVGNLFVIIVIVIAVVLGAKWVDDHNQVPMNSRPQPISTVDLTGHP